MNDFNSIILVHDFTKFKHRMRLDFIDTIVEVTNLADRLREDFFQWPLFQIFNLVDMIGE